MFGGYDPRDDDPRDRDDGIRDRGEEWLVLGRGPGTADLRDGQIADDPRDRDEDWREARDRDPRDRDDKRGSLDPRDMFMRDVDLPRGREREVVHDRGRDYSLNGSDTRTLSTVGAFRVVPERDSRDAAFDIRERDLRHLEGQGLIQRLPLDGHDRAVTAMRFTKARTKREAVVNVVAEFNRRRRMAELVRASGTFSDAFPSNRAIEALTTCVTRVSTRWRRQVARGGVEVSPKD